MERDGLGRTQYRLHMLHSVDPESGCFIEQNAYRIPTEIVL